LTQEEIKTLITNPDPQTPSHHQVDPRIIKAYLTGESVPTYLPREYRRDYHTWKHWLDANTRATDFLVDHLRDPLLTIGQVIEAPVHIPFVPTVRAAELRWWNGYFNTYHSFDDLILLRGHYQNSFN
jgi:hypothetical protein